MKKVLVVGLVAFVLSGCSAPKYECVDGILYQSKSDSPTIFVQSSQDYRPEIKCVKRPKNKIPK